MSTTQNGDNDRERASTPADAATVATRPGGASRRRSRARITAEVHRQIAADVSNPVGFTTPAKNSAEGVAATMTPASNSRERHHVTAAMTASARNSAFNAPLRSRIR